MRAAAKGKQNPERQRSDNPGDGHHQGDQQSAPARSLGILGPQAPIKRADRGHDSHIGNDQPERDQEAGERRQQFAAMAAIAERTEPQACSRQ